MRYAAWSDCVSCLISLFCLVMDMLVHWRVYRHLRKEIGATGTVLLAALAADAIVLTAFASVKLQSDPMVVLCAAIGILAVFAAERVYLSNRKQEGA